MSDDVINLGDFLERRDAGAPAGTMALWGAEGERSRFALPLWRVVHIASAERGVIFWQDARTGSGPQPFVALDVARDPARLTLPADGIGLGEEGSSQLTDHGDAGLVVRLGTREGRAWGLLTDGRTERAHLSPREREDVLFLAGECAGLLFLRAFADEAGE